MYHGLVLTATITTGRLPHWAKTDSGYRLDGGPVPATMHRVGKRTICTVDGVEHVLPARASFDHADAIVWAAAAE
jgi:hypothetical protein